MRVRRQHGGSRTMPSTQFEADARAPAAARTFVATQLKDSPDEMRERACQVVSELVTNSVRFGHGEEITVDAYLRFDGSLDLEVSDDGDGFDAVPKASGHADPDGWGLLFVDMLTDRWTAGGPGDPVVRTHFDPRSMNGDLPVADPLLEARLRDLLDVRMLLDSVKDYAIFALNREGRVTLWNSGGERLTGYAQDDILGSSLNRLHADMDVDAELPAALAHGRHEHEGWIVRKDGSRFWADSVVTPILDSQGALRGFSVVA